MTDIIEQNELNIEFPQLNNGEYLIEYVSSNKYLVLLKDGTKPVSFIKNFTDSDDISLFISTNFKKAKSFSFINYTDDLDKIFKPLVDAGIVIDLDSYTQNNLLEQSNIFNIFKKSEKSKVDPVQRAKCIGKNLLKISAISITGGTTIEIIINTFKAFLEVYNLKNIVTFLDHIRWLPTAFGLAIGFTSLILLIIGSIVFLILQCVMLNESLEESINFLNIKEKISKNIDKLKQILSDKLFKKFRDAVKKDLNVDIDNVV